MADNVGNLAVVMTLNNEQFNAGLRETTIQMQQINLQIQRTDIAVRGMGKSMAAVSTSMGSGSGGKMAWLQNLGPMIQQTSFAIQDMTSQLGTRGLGGALQAGANNVQMMGAAFGPYAMAGSAAIGVLMQGYGLYLEMQDRAAKKAKETARVTVDAWKEAAKVSNEQIREIARARAEFLGGLGFDKSTNFDNASPKELETSIQRADRRQAELDARRNEVLRTFDRRIQDRFGNLTADERPSSFFGLDVPGARAMDTAGKLRDMGFSVSNDMVKALNAVDKELRSIDAEGNKIYTEANARRAALDEAIKREKFNIESENAARISQEQMRRQESLRSAVSGDISVTSEIQRRRDQVNEAFRAGAITQLEKTVAENRIARDEMTAKQTAAGPKALTRDSDEVFAAMQRALRGEPSAADKQESIKKNTADTASATKETAKAVKKLTDRPVIVVRF